MRRRVALGLQLIARVVSLTGPVVASLDDRMWFDPELPSMAARRAPILAKIPTPDAEQ